MTVDRKETDFEAEPVSDEEAARNRIELEIDHPPRPARSTGGVEVKWADPNDHESPSDIHRTYDQIKGRIAENRRRKQTVGTGESEAKATPPDSPYGATYRPLDVSYAEQVEELRKSRFKRRRTRF